MTQVLKRIAASTATTALVATSLLAATAQPAAACPSGPFFTLTSTATRIPFSGLPIFTNGPGGTMTVTKKHTKKASYQINAGTSTELGAVLARAKVEISASLTKENATELTNEHKKDITPGWMGNAQYVSYGRKVNWKKQTFVNSCRSIVEISRGTISFPAASEGWYYWETRP